MITFDQARELVSKAVGSEWSHGTFHVSSSGSEDDLAFLVEYGAREWIVDGNVGFLVIPGGLALVDKRTAELDETTYLTDPDRFDNMTPVEATHPGPTAPPG